MIIRDIIMIILKLAPYIAGFAAIVIFLHTFGIITFDDDKTNNKANNDANDGFFRLYCGCLIFIFL